MSALLDTFRNHHKEMLITQAELNAKTNGEFYVTNKYRTDKNKFIHYTTCLKMEAAELLDSLPWKHWKHDNRGYDFDNIKIELVDLLHFTLSLSLDQHALFIQDLDKKQMSINDIAKSLIANDIDNEKSYYSETFYPILFYNVDDELAKSFKAINTLNMEPFIGFMHYIDLIFQFRMERNVNCVRSLYEAIYIMFGIVKMYSNALVQPIKLEAYEREVHDLYRAKLALNQVRQDNGYNAGTYKKTWILDGQEVEDNVFITRFVAKSNVPDNINMYNVIAKEYKKQIELQGE